MAGFFSLGSCVNPRDEEEEPSSPPPHPQPPQPPQQSDHHHNTNPNIIQQNLFPWGNTSTTPNPNPNPNPQPTSTPQPPPGVLLYRNEEIYQKGYEIWQQYVQVHQYPKLIHHLPPSSTHTQQDQQHQQQPPSLHPFQFHQYPAYTATPSVVGPSLMVGGRGASSSSQGSGSSRGMMTMAMMRSSSQGVGGAGGINCQDCGNQAKKDCTHMRCRTCCKSRGFDCATHVKSTWVPAAVRRERHQQRSTVSQHPTHIPQQQQQHLGVRSGEGDHHQSISSSVQTKRLRENIVRETARGAAAAASSSGLELGQHFPSEVSSPAVFRCVRVHSLNDTEEQQLAYQTAVNIGGHLFKGILYDQGPDQDHHHHRGSSSYHNSPPPQGMIRESSSGGIQHHNLLPPAAVAAHHHHNQDINAAPTSPDPNAAVMGDPGTSAAAAVAAAAAGAGYPTPISAFLAGTQFFPPPR